MKWKNLLNIIFVWYTNISVYVCVKLKIQRNELDNIFMGRPLSEQNSKIQNLILSLPLPLTLSLSIFLFLSQQKFINRLSTSKSFLNVLT